MSISPQGRILRLHTPNISTLGIKSINFESFRSKVKFPIISRKSVFRIAEIYPATNKRRNLTRISPDTTIKLTSRIEIEKIENLVKSKKELNLLQKINKSYVKLSSKQKLKDRLTINSSSESPPAFNSRIISLRKSGIRKMVDASIDTDDFTELKQSYLF